jgi:ring-1,2-phenylacetyl-CoA epoxidase subunit PaaE
MPLTSPPRFQWLHVRERRQEAADAVSLVFAVPAELEARYRFRAGQYLTLRTTQDGAEIRRAYSICSGADDGELRIAIKRVAGGSFSAWAQDALMPGVALEVMTPAGRFGIPALPDGANIHIAFAAGSGITPVLSILRTVLSREPESRVFLFYGSRTTQDILFRGALEDLKDRHLGRLSVFHALSREQQDVDVLNGRLDADKLGLLLRRVLGDVPVDAAYICGPSGMIPAALAALAARGVPPERVHVERFTSMLDGRPRPIPPAPIPLPPIIAAPHASGTIILDGARTEISIAKDEPVLDAALRAGLDLPFSCRGGMCSTCRAKLVAGRVDMAVNYSLEPWETRAGYVLTCQARAITPHVVIDYDQQ